MPLQRWIPGGKSAFGSGGEKNGEGVLLIFDSAATRLEATLFVPRDLTVDGPFANFYVGFNTKGHGGSAIVEAGVSLSSQQRYGPSPAAGFATGNVVMHHDNLFRNPANTQAGPLFWNVFINCAISQTVSSMPASGDLRGQTIPLVLEIAHGQITFRAGAITPVPVPFKQRIPVAHAKMVAAVADATNTSFSAATMRMDRLGGKAPPPGKPWRVNGSADSQTLEATVFPTMFTCETAAATAVLQPLGRPPAQVA